MAHLRRYVCAATLAASGLLSALGGIAHAQSGRSPAGEGTNVRSSTDRAAGATVDSLAAIQAKAKSPKFATPRKQTAQTRRQTPLTGKLVRNPDSTDGSAEYALVDRYGGVLRYVEPSKGVNLAKRVGQQVTVRRDTGNTLLASQLEFSAATPTVAPVEGNVQLADFEEELAEPGEPTPAGEESIVTPTPDERSYTEGDSQYAEGAPYIEEGGDYCGCETCGSMVCDGGCGPCRSARGIVYARVEYLLWDFKGFWVPPLVVEGDADDSDPNQPPLFVDAVVIYGNEEILDGTRDGIRFLGGIWLDDCGDVGIEGDYVYFDTESESFTAGGDGVTPPFIGRPFIDATTGLDAVEDVSFPGIMGDVTVDSTSDYESAGIRLRHNICTAGGSCGCGDTVGCGGGIGCGSGVGGCGKHFADIMFGFRYARLDESLIITEDLETVEASPSIPTTEILLQDRFFTENQFYGGEIGFECAWLHNRWSLELLSRVAIGNNKQEVHINGFTTTTFQGQDATKQNSGLLVQPTNAGDYERDQFVMIPEINATIGYQLTPRLRLTAGYGIVYWGNVVRPGDQIDLEVNPTYLSNPLPNPLEAPFRPKFAFNETDFWAHGLNLGGEMRW